MPQPSRPQPQPLEVTIMFEPTRAAPEVLHGAYDAVLPRPHRRLRCQSQGAAHGLLQAAEGSSR
jgi:hypothetical protein